MKIAEHDVVVLTHDLPEHNLRAGDVGAVVHVYPDGKAYEVEFVTGAGETLAVETLEPADIRPFGAGEILHIRSVTAA
jgi:Domain of unknown function (DUF4926)